MANKLCGEANSAKSIKGSMYTKEEKQVNKKAEKNHQAPSPG